ncbi:MAG TPA: hypothetical protein VJY85_06160, partial [Candidatus Limnocylindria bacterium]|nr:hypothetical protein [Candidatus Limnocylindria bacterium]
RRGDPLMDEPIEREVREWLAAEAAGPMPERLRSRVAVAQPPGTVGLFGLRRGWALIVVMALLAALLVGTTLFALGLLPPSPAACTNLTIDRVRTAVAGSGGYSYRIEGTTLASTFDPGLVAESADPFNRANRSIILEGGYQAPDRWRLDSLAGSNALDHATTYVMAFEIGTPTILRVGDAIWVRRWATPALIPEPPFAGDLAALEPNAVLSMLGEEDPVLNGRVPGAGALTWERGQLAEGGCTLRGTTTGRSVEVIVDPASARPLIAHTTAEWEGNEDQPPLDLRLTWSIDWQTPGIEAPVDVGPRPLTDEEAAAAAHELGLVDPSIVASATSGGAQAFVASDGDQHVFLSFQDGEPLTLSSGRWMFPEVRLDGAASSASFLYLLVDDPRVARIEVDLSSVEDRTVTVATQPFAQIIALPMGESRLPPTLNRWAAFDAAGNELVDLQEAP